MSGVQGKPFRVIFLAATILTLLATSSLSADIKTLRKQAEAGDAKAQFNLGVAYFRGQGVPRDVVKSYMWLSLAASRSAGEDHENYSRARDLAAKKLTSEKLMEAQRMTREWEKSHPKK